MESSADDAYNKRIRSETHRIYLSPVIELLKAICHFPNDVVLKLKQVPEELIPFLGDFPEKSVLGLKSFSDEIIIETKDELRISNHDGRSSDQINQHGLSWQQRESAGSLESSPSYGDSVSAPIRPASCILLSGSNLAHPKINHLQPTTTNYQESENPFEKVNRDNSQMGRTCQSKSTVRIAHPANGSNRTPWGLDDKALGEGLQTNRDIPPHREKHLRETVLPTEPAHRKSKPSVEDLSREKFPYMIAGLSNAKNPSLNGFGGDLQTDSFGDSIQQGQYLSPSFFPRSNSPLFAPSTPRRSLPDSTPIAVPTSTGDSPSESPNLEGRAGSIPRRYFCSLCYKKTFANRKTLENHVETLHDPRELYTCRFDGCRKLYSRKDSFVLHLQNVHNCCDKSYPAKCWSETPKKEYYPCYFCPSHFSHLKTQVNHMVDHQDHGMTRMNLNYSTVMKDLLVHPEVRQAWEELKTKKWERPEDVKLEWYKEPVVDLLRRLEHAKVKYGPQLAMEAYNLLPPTLKTADQQLSQNPSSQQFLLDQQSDSTPRTRDDATQVNNTDALVPGYHYWPNQLDNLPPESTNPSNAESLPFMSDDNDFGTCLLDNFTRPH